MRCKCLNFYHSEVVDAYIEDMENYFLFPYTGVLKSSMTLDLHYFDLYLANETSDKYGAVDVFVPYDLRNNLICYMTFFGHSIICFLPIETVILKTALYRESDIKTTL